MSHFGCKSVKFFVELPTFDCKICLFSLKITPFYYPKTKFKHTLKTFFKCKINSYFCTKYYFPIMNEQDRKFKELWEKRQLQGRFQYGLVNGSFFGFMVFIIINLFSLKEKSFQDVYLTYDALSQMLTMVLAGIIGYSTLKWWMNQNIYNKIIEREKNGGK